MSVVVTANNITLMSDETQMEETLDNQEEKTTSETTQEQNSQNSSENERRLFARAKKAEEELKRLKELVNGKEPANQETKKEVPELNEINLAKKVKALASLDNAVIDFAEVYAKGKGIDVLEAIGTEEVRLYAEALSEKIKKDNLTPDPSSKQSQSSKTVDDVLEKGGFKELSFEEKKRLIKEADQRYK